MDVDRISPGWEGIFAQGRMQLFPGLPDTIAVGLTVPLVVAHRLWFQLASRVKGRDRVNDFVRRIRTAGEFFFVADVPG